jgi:flagellar motor switch protein FliN/FliY
MSEEDDIMAAWGAALNEQAEAEKKAAEAKAESAEEPDDHDDRSHLLNAEGADVEAVPLENFGGPAPISKEEKRRLDSILDIPVIISMEVGRSQISIRNLLQLNQGSVVELERVAGEPLDVMVNGTLIAHGEVVVVNDKFGIRLTDVISQTERIKKLK